MHSDPPKTWWKSWMPRCPKKKECRKRRGTTPDRAGSPETINKGAHLPLLDDTRTSAYAPGDAIDAPDPAVSSQLTTILVTAALKCASAENVAIARLPSSDVTLHSDAKFSPSGAVTAPKVTELHCAVTSLECIPL